MTMTNQEIISIVKKARMVKPYARVHFPYSVEHVERILGITFNDKDRKDMQKFYDTANFFLENCNWSCDNPLYPIIYQMSERTDFLTIQETDLLIRSLRLATNGGKPDVSDIEFFRFEDDLEIWVYAPMQKYVFDVNMSLIRRAVNLANFFNEKAECVELEPTYTYEDYGAYENVKKNLL